MIKRTLTYKHLCTLTPGHEVFLHALLIAAFRPVTGWYPVITIDRFGDDVMAKIVIHYRVENTWKRSEDGKIKPIMSEITDMTMESVDSRYLCMIKDTLKFIGDFIVKHDELIEARSSLRSGEIPDLHDYKVIDLNEHQKNESFLTLTKKFKQIEYTSEIEED